VSQPDVNGDRSERPTTAWGDAGTEETQVVRPQSDASGQPVGAGATPVNPSYGGPGERNRQTESDTAQRPGVENSAGDADAVPGNAGSGGWSTYSDRPQYSGDSTMTSVYPQSEQPGYAPAGQPGGYAPATAVAAPPAAAAPERTSNRVAPAFLCALAGILLTAGGMLLLGRYGIPAGSALTRNSVDVKDSLLATIGAVLVLGAVVLNGWSPWATVIPGLVLTGIGGWALYDTRATVRGSRWTNSVLTTNQLTIWHVSGVTLTVGLMMLAASAAAAIARASGKRDGRILGRREV